MGREFEIKLLDNRIDLVKYRATSANNFLISITFSGLGIVLILYNIADTITSGFKSFYGLIAGMFIIVYSYILVSLFNKYYKEWKNYDREIGKLFSIKEKFLGEIDNEDIKKL